MTTVTMRDIESLEVGNSKLREENYALESKLKGQGLDKDSFEEDNEKVLFYTGLTSWQILLCLFNFVLPFFYYQNPQGVCLLPFSNC